MTFASRLAILVATVIGPSVAGGQLSMTIEVELGELARARKQLLEDGGRVGAIRSPAAGGLAFEATDHRGNAIEVETPGGESRPSGDVATEVEAAVDRYLEAFNSGDWEASLGIYAEDPRFHWVDEGRGSAYMSRGEVEAATASVYGELEDFELTFANRRVTPIAPTVALVECDYRQRMSFGPDQTVAFAGEISVLLERIAGRWQFLAGHSSGEAIGEDAPPR